MNERINVAVAGTGFIGRHMVTELTRRPDYSVSAVITRRPLAQLQDFPRADLLTNDLERAVEQADVVFEATGDCLHTAHIVDQTFAAGKPVVTLNAEFHATVGSYFVDRGVLSEAEGDQPGCLAALREDAIAMGFEPLVYGNMKSFLDRTPTPESMQSWADRQGYSIEMVTSFTDGTKVQIEQCLVANGLGAAIAKEEMLGLQSGDLQVIGRQLGVVADALCSPISEYIVDRRLQHGVFIVARHDSQQAVALRNYKLGDGPYYLLVKDYCLVHLEAIKTIERVVRTGRSFLNNSAQPRVSVAAVAKKPLDPGQRISRGCGSFELRGICVNIASRKGHLPICLANDLVIRRRIEPGEILTLADVDLPDSLGLKAWLDIEARCCEQPAVSAA